MSTLATAARILRGRTDARALGFLGSTTITGSSLPGMVLGSGGLEVNLDQGERGWSGLAAAYRCVQIIATNLASVDMTIMAGDQLDDTDPLVTLWNRGGGEDSPYSSAVVKQVMYARAELTGQAFAYLDRDGNPQAPPRGIHPIFDRVTLVVANVQDRPNGQVMPRLLGFTVHTSSGRQVDLLPQEVLWLRYPDPFTPWGAVAPWKAALYAAEVDAYARAWQRNMLRNDARPSMIVNAGTQANAQEWEAMQAAWRSKVTGPGNGGKSLLLASPTPIDAKTLTFTPAEMGYMESRKANADEMMLAFGVRRDVLFGESTYENQRAAKTALWSDTLLPKLDTFAAEVDRQMVPDPGRTVAWDLSEVDALRESQDAIIKRASDATYPDILMLDEARSWLGLEPLPNGAGQATLTAYRERVRAGAQIDVMNATAGVPRSSAVPPRLIRHRGTTTLVRRKMDEAAARAAASVGSTLAAYDRHEAIGVRAIRRLSARQEATVMRELNKLRSDRYGPAILERWAAVLAAGGWSTRTLEVFGARTIVTAASHPEGVRALADDLFDVTYWTRETEGALEDFMAGTWAEGGERAATAFGASWDVLDPKVTQEMEARLRVLARDVTATTHDVIESQILTGGVLAGESVDDLASRIRTVFSDLSTWRAVTIARTEVVGGFNGASHTVARESGVVGSRQWLATGDTRTRPSHRAQNGHTLAALEERYPNGCLFPGDPAAPAGETVNCRCVELFNVEA